MSDFLDEALGQMDERLGMDAPNGEAYGENPADPAESEDTAQPDTTPEPPAEAPQDDRPRDEQGRFTKETDEERLFAGKYKSPEELERAYLEAQSRMGEQGSELGEIRREIQALREAQQAPETPSVQINQGTVDWFDEQVEQNAQAAAMWAKDNDPSGTLLNRAMEYWHDENPVAAMGFIMDERLKAQTAHYEQLLAERTAPLQAMTTQSAIEQAWNAGREKFPDIDDRAQQIIEAAQRAPKLAEGLQSDDPNERESTIENLYYLAGGMAGLASGPAPDTNTETAAALQQAARDAKLSGTVASQTQVQEPEAPDEGSQWLKDIGFDAILDAHDPDKQA